MSKESPAIPLLLAVLAMIPFRAFPSAGAAGCMVPLMGAIPEHRILPDLGRGSISAVALKNTYARLPSKPVFSSPWGLRWLGLKLNHARLFEEPPANYSPLKRDRWVDSVFSPEESQQRYDDQERKMRAFLGEGNFSRLQEYLTEVKDLLEANFDGDLLRFDVAVRGLSRRDLQLKLSHEGLAQGGHRHIYCNENFVEVSVLKTEAGPSTVVRDAEGRPFQPGNQEVVILTDAWHATPASTDDRVVILVEARFVSDLYCNYNVEGEYPDDGH